jgi:hypothetical protein
MTRVIRRCPRGARVEAGQRHSSQQHDISAMDHARACSALARAQNFLKDVVSVTLKNAVMPSQNAPTFRTTCRRRHTATGAERGTRPHTQTTRECRFARRIARTQSPDASAQILRCRETLPWGPPDPTRAPFPSSFLTLLNGSRE